MTSILDRISGDLFDSIMGLMDWTIDRGDFKNLVLVCARWTNRLHKATIAAEKFMPSFTRIDD